MASEKSIVMDRVFSHGAFKRAILSMVDWNTVEDLADKLIFIRDGLDSGAHIQLPQLKTAEQIIGFWNSNYTNIDRVLMDTDWFDRTPSEMGIGSIHIYVIKSTKKAIAEACRQILEENLNKQLA